MGPLFRTPWRGRQARLTNLANFSMPLGGGHVAMPTKPPTIVIKRLLRDAINDRLVGRLNRPSMPSKENKC